MWSQPMFSCGGFTVDDQFLQSLHLRQLGPTGWAAENKDVGERVLIELS